MSGQSVDQVLVKTVVCGGFWTVHVDDSCLLKIKEVALSRFYNSSILLYWAYLTETSLKLEYIPAQIPISSLHWIIVA